MRSPSIQLALAVALLSCWSGSCASIVTGSEDTVQVLSTPPGAIFSTNTGQRGRTPSTITIPDNLILTVDYELEGHERARAELRPRWSGWVAGNLLLGGIVGLVIDFASGNYRTHSETVSATLLPLPPGLTPNATQRPTSTEPDVWTGASAGSQP